MPADAPHVHHAKQIDLLKKHIEHFESAGDPVRAAQYASELKHTADRLEHAKRAAAVVDGFGLSHEITPATIAYNDAVNFVAKTLHEVAQGQKRTAQGVIDHLGLTDSAHIAAVRDLFAGKVA